MFLLWFYSYETSKTHSSWTRNTQEHEVMHPALREAGGKFLLKISGLLGQAPHEDSGVDETGLYLPNLCCWQTQMQQQKPSVPHAVLLWLTAKKDTLWFTDRGIFLTYSKMAGGIFFFQLRDTDAVPTLLNKAESVSELSAGLLIAWADSLSARLSPTVPSGMRAWVKPLLLWIPPLNTVSQHPPGGLNTPKHPGCPNTVPTMHTYRLMQYRHPPVACYTHAVFQSWSTALDLFHLVIWR